MIEDLPSFQALKNQQNSAAPSQDAKLRQIDGAGLTLDFTRTAPDDETWQLLLNLIDESDLQSWRDKLFAGDTINVSEKRAAWHTRLRAQPFAPEVAAMHQSMQAMVDDMKQRGIKDVVSVGIGGSDLGPRLVVDALWQNKKPENPNVHFLHNVDPVLFEKITRNLNPETTAFIFSSKSFSTEETKINAAAAKTWLGAKLDYLYAATTQPDKAVAIGVPEHHIVKFEEWVGGRFSVGSAVGMPIAIACGMDVFKKFLSGAEMMDHHFLASAPAQNLPITLALLTVYHANLCGLTSESIIPYLQDLDLLPSYLQQLIMESNGKSTSRDGKKLTEKTSPVIFGSTGTNSQHSFFQALHQGTTTVPVQIILALQSASKSKDGADALFANAIAQSNALAENGRPCSLIAFDHLNAKTLGSLLALYEHMVFVQGILWEINSFDQPGVELGKKLAAGLKPYVLGMQSSDALDVSTDSLIQKYKNAS